MKLNLAATIGVLIFLLFTGAGYADNSTTVTNPSITLLNATSTIYVDSCGYTDQAVHVTGFVTENGTGTNDMVAIYIEGAIFDLVQANKAKSGYFYTEVGGGYYYNELGAYTLTASVTRPDGGSAEATTTFNVQLAGDGGCDDNDNETDDGGDENDTGDEDTDAEYIVGVQMSPGVLRLEAGENGEYEITIRNYGTRKDTYDIELDVREDIEDWFDLEDDKVTINAGERETITLYVDVPENEDTTTYSIRISAESDDAYAEDDSRLDLTERGNRLDIEIDTPRVSPTTIKSDYRGTVLVSAPITFRNLDSYTGDNVRVELYIDGEKLDDQSIYFADGETRTARFYISAADTPIERQAGKYEIYFKASVDLEKDTSRSTMLEVEEGGGLIVSTSKSQLNATQNGNFTATLVINNMDSKENTYLLISDGLDIVNLQPGSITVGPESAKTIEISGQLNNTPVGNFTVDIHIKSDDDDEYVTYRFFITGEDEGGDSEGSGLSGYLTLGTGSAAIGMLLVMALAGYYFYQQKQLGENKGEDTAATPNAGAPVAPAGKKKLFDLGKIKTISAAPMERKWTPKDADRVVGNLGTMKAVFTKNIAEAQQIQNQLGTAAEPEQKSAAKTGDDYVNGVVSGV
ncbi:MAG: hypothetical protein ABIG20_01540 [archaeon]